MKNTKGITLIALIITIIVMLILVAVTINVALNGGLFGKATEAQTKTQREIAREELTSVMIGAYNGKGKFDKDLVGTLPNGAKWCSEDAENWNTTTAVQPTGTGDWIITKENNKFYIDKDGSVLDEKPEESNDITGVVYECDMGAMMQGLKVYLYFVDSSNLKMKQVMGETTVINAPQQYQIRKDPSYAGAGDTVFSEPQILNGRIIEVDNSPYAKIGDDGTLFMIYYASDENNNNVIRYFVGDEVEPNLIIEPTDLDPDTFFNE